MIQGQDTLIERQHSTSSVKGKSRSVALKRAHISKSSNNKKVVVNKCQCTFIITVIYEPSSRRWFLKQRQRYKETAMYHNNHIWINPSHNFTSKRDLPPELMESILSMIKSGSNATSIQLYVKSTHHINIDYHMIYKIRSSHINELISQCSTNPYGSTVDNLIALFKATDHVSCVYLLHNFDSGFVTYRKNASSKNHVEKRESIKFSKWLY